MLPRVFVFAAQVVLFLPACQQFQGKTPEGICKPHCWGVECGDGGCPGQPDACGTCQTGYLCNADFGCEDIDECVTETDNCHVDAICTNMSGGFTCTCNDGYTGDGVTCETGTLAELRAMPDGPVDMLLVGVYVTYVTPSSYCVQAEREGPAIHVDEWPDSTTELGIAVGNQISLHVAAIGTWNHGSRYIVATLVSNDLVEHDVDGLLSQDLSVGNGQVPSEDLESELVLVTEATVLTGCDPWEIVYGGDSVLAEFSTLAELSTSGVCAGATVQVRRAVVRKYRGYRIWSRYASDIATQDVSNCQGDNAISVLVFFPDIEGTVGLWLEPAFHDTEYATMTGNGYFTFETRLFDGEYYRVRAQPEPPYQECFFSIEDAETYTYGTGRAGCYNNDEWAVDCG